MKPARSARIGAMRQIPGIGDSAGLKWLRNFDFPRETARQAHECAARAIGAIQG
jgi:hypothetical protein